MTTTAGIMDLAYIPAAALSKSQATETAMAGFCPHITYHLQAAVQPQAVVNKNPRKSITTHCFQNSLPEISQDLINQINHKGTTRHVP